MYNGSNGKTCPPTTLSFIAYAPPATAAILLSSIVASSVFLFLHFFTTFPDREWLTSPSKFESIASHTITAHLTAWSGVGSFVMGLIGTIIWHSIFATRVQDFNEKIASLGGNSGKSPQLIAEIGSGFTCTLRFRFLRRTASMLNEKTGNRSMGCMGICGTRSDRFYHQDPTNRG
jgi:hypothetical protein